jgi:dolichyl-phosphate-mannose--protein O-mannosyl transferase
MATPTLDNATEPTSSKPLHPVKRFFRRLFLYMFIFFLLYLLGFYLYCNYTYSEGSRAGMLMKFSKKGNIFKTYEGELNLGGINPIPGNTIANNVWSFSVKDDSIGKLLEDQEGHILRLHYKEKKKNLPWQGETPYFVDRVTVLK